MCGRYTVSSSLEKIQKKFKAALNTDIFKQRFNAAPGQNLPVITDKNPKKIQLFRWGYIPFWAKDEKIGYRMINARAETVTEKLAYKKAFLEFRCLVTADGFYEWKRAKGGRVPYRIFMKDEEPFAFAGLWSCCKDVNSFTILTTEANSLVGDIHERMPVILKEEDYTKWLGKNASLKELKDLLRPFDSKKMDAYEVSKIVNIPSNDFPEVMGPVK
ncbi:SOS response-associated peptidase [Candidatus Peregrinibacteria bacterium]|nr:SOS response-associated peptidase [Candidatus Peregrinibacteria bacterium]